MRPPLKLNAIEQEHLQELYNSAGVARDELPYTEQFDALCRDFQDRAFKNADPEQVYASIVRYVRSSTCASKPQDASPLTDEQLKQLQVILRKQGASSRLQPYSSEFEAAMKEFASVSALTMTPRDFWLAVCRIQGRSRKPPRPPSRKREAVESDTDDL